MYNRENNNELTMEDFVRDYRVFIDTCSAYSPKCELLFQKLEPLLKKYNNRLIVPNKVLQEILKHSADDSVPERQEKAEKARTLMYDMYAKGLVAVKGEPNENFADNVFLTQFTKHRLNYNLLLITQDTNLTEDVLALNNQKSNLSKFSVCVRRIDPKTGGLALPRSFNMLEEKRNMGQNASEAVKKSAIKTSGNKSASREAMHPFGICNEITAISQEVIPTSKIPGEGDTVYVYEKEKEMPRRRTLISFFQAPRQAVKLGKLVSAGGEGSIYLTDTPYVAKIYKKEKITARKYAKIKRMLEHPLECEGICYPTKMLLNTKDEFVGFLMPMAKGKELQKSIFIKPLFLKNFPNWKKRDTVELCVTILEKMMYLHQNNVIIGDINPANILVVSPREVYFVDVDSYQIEEFPCPVGTVNFTAPEIQKKNFSSFLRTIGNERFAVATLLFMIMLPGKPPYAQQGGEDPLRNIIGMDFSYPFGNNSNKKTPIGPWRFIWSHLTYEIKEAFYNTFRKDGTHASEDTRLSDEEWLLLFSRYLNLLDSGKFGKQDAMSEELFPTRLKKNINWKYTLCKLCGEEVPEQTCKEGICGKCLHKGKECVCKECGKAYCYTNERRYVKKQPDTGYCFDCYEKRNTYICVDCGEPFRFGESAKSYYEQHGLDAPKRCKKCRKARKNAGR